MGGFNMKRAISSLDGVPLPIKWGTCKKTTKKYKVGDTIMRDLDPYDLALLLAIASQQFDPPLDDNKNELYPDIDWFCFGSKEELMRLSHVKKHKFYKCERYLLESGLVTYKKREYYRDIYNLKSQRKRCYKNVYRLNKAKLDECLVISRAIKAQAQGGNVPEEAENVPLGESNVPQGDANVPRGNPQITIHENNEKDNNKSGGVDRNKELELRYQKLIAKSLGVELEEVGLPSVRKYALGKDPEKIAEIANKIRTSKSYTNKIGALFAKLKELPKVNYTPEEMKAKFSEVERPPAAKTSPADESIENGWNQLVADLGLEALDDKEKKNLMEDFSTAMRTHAPAKIPNFVNNFIDRIARENGGSFEALKKANPDIKQRVAILRNYIEKEANS